MTTFAFDADRWGLDPQKLHPLLSMLGSSIASMAALRAHWEQLIPKAVIGSHQDGEESEWGTAQETTPILKITGDARIFSGFHEQLFAAGLYRVWVSGDLYLQEPIHWPYSLNTFYVEGNVFSQTLALSSDRDHVTVQGHIHATQLATYYASDDGDTRQPQGHHLRTPLLFLWFVDFAPPLILSPETVVFAVGDFEELTQQSLETDQPMLIWHECAYALRDELYEQIEEPWYNNILWKTEEMGQLLSNGESIWREGFTPEAIQPWRAGQRHLQGRQTKEALQQFNLALQLAPGFAPAAQGAGEMLFRSGAYQQALPYLQQAHALFPKYQTAMADPSVYYLTHSLDFLGLHDEAIAIAQAELARTSNQSASVEAHQYLAGYWLSHDQLEKAEASVTALSRELDSGISMWLTGLWHHKLAQREADPTSASEHRKQAENSFQCAISKGAVLAKFPYDSHDSLRAIWPKARELDLSN